MRKPDFNQLLKVLDKQQPDRPTLFEFFLNTPLYKEYAGFTPENGTLEENYRFMAAAFGGAGYDYATVPGSRFTFPAGEVHTDKTRSLNEGTVIRDRASFEAYTWQEPDQHDYSTLDTVPLPEGMKWIVSGPGGVLENAIGLVGYDQLCVLMYEDPTLTQAIFDAVGSRLVRHYERSACKPAVGACISNDDWGFKTQTMLSPVDMRKYVFPWHVRIVDAIHKEGKPAILHSCGFATDIMSDIVNMMHFDGKHSFEDVIQPIEDAYEQYHGQVALLGGIDVDFICRNTPERVYERTKAMLQRAQGRGSYAVGTGNSVPEYVPTAGYKAMIAAALDGTFAS